MTGRATTPRLPVPSWGFLGESRPKGGDDRTRADCYQMAKHSVHVSILHSYGTCSSLSSFTGSKARPKHPADPKSHRKVGQARALDAKAIEVSGAAGSVGRVLTRHVESPGFHASAAPARRGGTRVIPALGRQGQEQCEF